MKLLMLGIVLAHLCVAQAPVEVTVPAPPAPLRANGKTHLVYELHLANFSPRDLALARVEIPGVASYEGAALSDRIAPSDVAEKRLLGGWKHLVVYLWLTVDAPPAALQHRLTLMLGDRELLCEAPPVPVGNTPLPIGAPLRGTWVAMNGPSNISIHRRALQALSGKARIAQRFAIDWMQLDDQGKAWTGDQAKNASYRGYGAEILGVADAVVSAVKDGIPENVPGATSRAVPITLETVGGNHVMLDLGSGRYALYGHMQPGSLRVKVGDRVRRGQILGLVGNSGNSTAPHLHFHVADANSPLGAEGLPFAFDSFELLGQGFGWKPSPDSKPETRRLEIPLQNMVVRFP